MSPSDVPASPVPEGRTPAVRPSALTSLALLDDLDQHPPEGPGADAADRLLLETAAPGGRPDIPATPSPWPTTAGAH
ncbi:hypothetical protein [Nesterenkonia sp. PF2B19]|uniref:hypothetical protein n=1 Tax=Nesterenkonia sp. PF2B19 TaxID=1881858 RepID=UPI00111C04AE|nr:hypothetical protein [Nesterenkonia sp. PF2B19]